MTSAAYYVLQPTGPHRPGEVITFSKTQLGAGIDLTRLVNLGALRLATGGEIARAIPAQVTIPGAVAGGTGLLSSLTTEGAPTNGPNGTYAGQAAAGAELIDIAAYPPQEYVNTGTATSPIWTPQGGGPSWLFAPAGWDACWRAARDASTTTPARITYLGDSITFGLSASNSNTTGYPWQVRSALATAGFPAYADWWQATGHGALTSASLWDNFTGYPWQVNAANNTGSANRFGGFGAITWFTSVTTTGNPPQLIFTSPYATTHMTLWYYDSIASTWAYQLDGGSIQTVTCTGSGSYKQIDFTGLANTTHVLNCWSVSDSSTPTKGLGMQLAGIFTYTGAAGGIIHSRVGYAGAKAGDWLGTGLGDPQDRILPFTGALSRQTGTYTGFGAPAQPHLLVLELGINDANQAAGADVFAGNIQKFVQACRRGTPGCSVLFLVPYYPDNYVSDNGNGGFSANAGTYYQYVARLYDLATAHRCAVANFQTKWGEITAGAAPVPLLSTNDVHPQDAGYADMASAVAGLL